jgi:hypothetical protein
VVRAWLTVIWKSFGVAVVVAAAELGVSDAVGITRWRDPSADAWSVLLTWVAFSYAAAVLSGAAVGPHALRQPRQAGQPDGVLARVVATFVAGLGATAAIEVALLQTQATTPGLSAYPDLVVASTAGAGVVVGIVVALIAAAVPAVKVNVRATIGWIWLVGVGCAVAGTITHRPFDPPGLGVVDAPSLVPATWWSGPNLMIAVALLMGLAVAGVARWAGAGRVGAGASGFAGPAVVAAAYVIAWPGMGPAQSSQLDPYRAAAIAVGAGLLGSLLVAVIPHRGARAARAARAASAPADGTRPAAGRARPATQRVRPAIERTRTPERAEGWASLPTQRPADEEPTWALPSQHRAPDPGIMGQPRNSFEEDYSDWLRDLGHAPGRSNENTPARGISPQRP